MEYATLGCISSGTLRTVDLLPVFADAIEHLLLRNDTDAAHYKDVRNTLAEARQWLDSDADTDEHRDDGAYLLEEMSEALQDFAPPYCYFGASEGDPADFGFWLSWDALGDEFAHRKGNTGEDLPCPCCADFDEFLQVNDHGNAGLYALHETTPGHREWREVWSVV